MEMKGCVIFKVFVVFIFCGIALGKECTNTFPISSHTIRHEILTSKNDSWREEMFSHYHLTPTDDSTWSNLMPRKILREEDDFSWNMMYRRIKNQGGSEDFLKEMSLHDVRLGLNSLHWQAQQTNLEYLLLLDVDRLVWSFRETAGLPTPGKAYGGWETPGQELRGHFVGHYMSASAQMWASTHNDTLKDKMSAVVSALFECQKKIGSGYLSAFPTEFFDRFEAIKTVWAPYYTIHKIMAGLLDQYILADNAQALEMTKWMADYFYNRVQNVITTYSVERHWYSLNEETGGMNDVLYKLFMVTNEPKHLLLAHLFDKPCFLGLLAIQADNIAGFHTNTHIPIVIGSQMRYEITGDPLYKMMGTFFMAMINSSHSYATGGTSFNEAWTEPKRLASALGTETEESCTTYNMLKVSRNLFRWTKEVAYADYYERALTNGVLSIQRGTEPGVMIYMLPLAPGVSKAKSYHGWGTKEDSFWCCYGTGIESFSKLGDSIYFEEEGKTPGLYVIQYISSTVNWKSGKIIVNQVVDPVVSTDPFLRVTLTIKGSGPSSALNLRIPSWTNLIGSKASINGQNLALPAPGNFLTVTRSWNDGDKLNLQLPITLRTEAIKDDRSQYATIQSILYGPYLLAGHSTGDWDVKTGSAQSLSDWITPVPTSYNQFLVTFTQKSGHSTFVLANSNHTLTMEKYPAVGTDAALRATFRLILSDKPSSRSSSFKDYIGKSVMLEPINFPGMLVSRDERNNKLVVTSSSSNTGSSIFKLVAGVDGNTETVSLESIGQKGCFISGGTKHSSGMKLSCGEELSQAGYNNAASFVIGEGVSKYHPISFIAKGAKQDFLLQPLLSFMDEFYTVHFNIQV